MFVLGISACCRDSSAVLTEDGDIVAAAQEERFSRVKHDSRFPTNALEYCLREGNVRLSDIEKIVVCGTSPSRERFLLHNRLAFSSDVLSCGHAFIRAALNNIYFKKYLLLKKLFDIEVLPDLKKRLMFFDYDFCQAASGFFPSPFFDAAVLAFGGANSLGKVPLIVGSNNRIMTDPAVEFYGSVGTLYSAFTSYAGFKINSGEYKLMGLAPYGKAKYTDVILHKILKMEDSGSFKPNRKYFEFHNGFIVPNKTFAHLFGFPARKSGEALSAFYMDLAASIQAATEKIIIQRCLYIRKNTGAKNLCIASDLAQNCVVNGKIFKENIFENIWIQPASGGAGGALGAALAGYYLHTNRPRNVIKDKDGMKASLLGPSFTQNVVEKRLNSVGAIFVKFSENEIIKKTASALAEGKAVGWMQGHMEFGSRALGNRSILADPRNSNMQKLLNSKIKYRESFRPFAPSVLQEDAKDWFDINVESPYMLLAAQVKKDKFIPAATHIDGSARIQTVSEKNNPRYHALLSEFKKLTGCPTLVNTSFNVRGEPIVCSPEDAFHCFMGTDIEILVVENCFLEKNAQKIAGKKDYKERFELD